MRSRFDEQLSQLNREMIEMGALCEEVIALASKALTGADLKLAAKVRPLSAEINRKEQHRVALPASAFAAAAGRPGPASDIRGA